MDIIDIMEEANYTHRRDSAMVVDIPDMEEIMVGITVLEELWDWEETCSLPKYRYTKKHIYSVLP